MDVASIAERSGIPQRKLRYVLDHDLIPGLVLKQQGRGHARRFLEPEAIALITAGSLFQFGVSASHIRLIFDALQGAEPTVLMDTLYAASLVIASQADCLYFKYQREWYTLPELTKAGKISMPVTMQVNLKDIRRMVGELQRKQG